MAQGNLVAAEPVRVMMLTSGEGEHCLHALVGLLFAGIIGGCQCADDPTPLDALPEYAVLEIRIDHKTGTA
jgi:hypothetical protein